MIPAVHTRKGFFFLLDTIFAFVVLVIGTIVIFSASSQTFATVQAVFSAHDSLYLLSNVKVADTTQPYILDLRFNKTLTRADLDRTLLETIILMQSRGNTSVAAGIFNAFLNTSLTSHYNILFIVNGTTIVNRTRVDMLPQDVPTMLVERQIVYVLENATSLIGPVVTEVRVW